MASGKQKNYPKTNCSIVDKDSMINHSPESMVQKLFLKTGITNALDDIQDNEITEED